MKKVCLVFGAGRGIGATVAEKFGQSSGFKSPVIESTGSGGGMKMFCKGVGTDTPDITNASNVGKKDMSLEDYYQRRILNNNTENRLGGSKQALKYLKKMPQDNNGKVSFSKKSKTIQ